MRSLTSCSRLLTLILVSTSLAFVSGCGEQQLPEPAYSGASRDLMENPLGAAAKLKGADAEKAKLSAKVEAARKKAAAADPRAK